MTKALSLLGAVLPSGLMEAHADNPVGFWESERIADFNDEILQALDSEWDDVFAFRPRPYLSNFDRVFVGRAVELLQQEFDGAELIVFKDPRVSVLTAFWERALREAGYSTTYVIMVRNPLEIAESLRMRNSFPRDKSLLLWSSYMIAVERDTRALPRTFVCYDDLMRDWRKVRARIQDAAAIPFPRDTAAAANEIDRFLDGRLRHHQSSADDLAARDDVPEFVKTLYRVFGAACGGAKIDEQAIDAAHAELAKLEASVGSLVADLRAHARSLEKEIVDSKEAERGALDRAKALSDELVAQRERIAEIEAAVEREQAAARAARDELLEALHDKTSSESVFNQHIDALTEELRQKDAAVADAQARLATQASVEASLRERLAALSDELLVKEAAVAETQAKLAEKASLEASLSDRIAALSEDLRQKDAAIRQAQESFELAQSEKRSVEARLQERFGELASLTKMLAQAEGREEEARADADWLRETSSILLENSTTRKGRLLALLPASFHARRRRRLLKQMGLFDDDAYLAANPDVQAERADPLGHYIKHGIVEDRRRG